MSRSEAVEPTAGRDSTVAVVLVAAAAVISRARGRAAAPPAGRSRRRSRAACGDQRRHSWPPRSRLVQRAGAQPGPPCATSKSSSVTQMSVAGGRDQPRPCRPPSRRRPLRRAPTAPRPPTGSPGRPDLGAPRRLRAGRTPWAAGVPERLERERRCPARCHGDEFGRPPRMYVAASSACSASAGDQRFASVATERQWRQHRSRHRPARSGAAARRRAECEHRAGCPAGSGSVHRPCGRPSVTSTANRSTAPDSTRRALRGSSKAPGPSRRPGHRGRRAR